MTSPVVGLSCGDYNCVYGNKEDEEITYGGCKCLPYPNRQDGIGVEKIKSAKWAMHTLRRQNKQLQGQIGLLSDMLYDQK